MRKFSLSYDGAKKFKERIDACDAKKGAWYPGKPYEEPKESLDDFIKRITPKRK